MNKNQFLENLRTIYHLTEVYIITIFIVIHKIAKYYENCMKILNELSFGKMQLGDQFWNKLPGDNL